MFKKLLFSTLLCVTTFSGFCQIVNIPDANFKACLLANTSLNTNGDSEIQVSEASTFTGGIDCQNLNISDATGITEFINITGLNLTGNPLMSIDLSNNIELNVLRLIGSDITSVDLSNNSEIRTFLAQTSEIATVTFPNPSSLRILNLRATNITTLDVSSLADLEVLSISNNDLTSLDLTNNLALEDINCSSNLLTNLDVSNNPSLVEFRCTFNTPLTSLVIANGNNINFTTMNVNGNPNLSCIEVDMNIDLNNPPAGWQKDDDTQYSYDCDNLSVDDTTLNMVSVYPNPFSSSITIQGAMQIDKVTITDITGKQMLSTTQTTININNLTSGLYLLTIEASGQKITKKIIKN